MTGRSESEILRNALRQYLGDNSGDIRALEARVEQLEARVAEQEQRVEQRQDELDAARRRYESAVETLDELDEELADARGALDEAEAEFGENAGLGDAQDAQESDGGDYADVPDAAIERVEKRLRGEDCWTRNGGVDRSVKPGPGGKTVGGAIFPEQTRVEEVADSYGIAAPRLVAAVRDRYPDIPDHAFIRPDIDTENWNGVDPDGYAVDSDGNRLDEQYPELVEDIELDDVLEQKRNDPRFSV